MHEHLITVIMKRMVEILIMENLKKFWGDY